MKDKRITRFDAHPVDDKERIITFIVPTGTDLIVGAIAPSRFYAVEGAQSPDRCEGTTIREPGMPEISSVEV